MTSGQESVLHRSVDWVCGNKEFPSAKNIPRLPFTGTRDESKQCTASEVPRGCRKSCAHWSRVIAMAAIRPRGPGCAHSPENQGCSQTLAAFAAGLGNISLILTTPSTTSVGP